MKLSFNFFRKNVNFIWNKKTFSYCAVTIPKAETAGITSRCTDLKHVLFLDYDNIEKWIVEDELKILQKQYKLTPFYLFTTQEDKNIVSGNLCGNYHCICLTKMPVHKISEIQSNTHIDWKYKKMYSISRYKTWVLRAIEKGDRDKPKYLGIVGDIENMDNEVSTAHFNLLKQLYDVDELDYENEDGLKEAFLTSYKTAAGV